MKLVTQKELESELLQKPYFQKLHPFLDLEFAIIDALIRARLEKGLTQAQIAEKAGTKQSAIARFESGLSNPTLDFIQRIAEALDLKLSVSVKHSA